MMRLAVAQTRTDLQDRAVNVAQAVTYVEQAAAQNADLVLLPETYPGPWTPPLDYDAEGALAAAALKNDVFVAFGHIVAVEERPGWYYTCHTLLDNRGERIGTYRRTTPSGPWLYKDHWFWDFNWQEGNEWPVFNTPWGRVGIAICSEVYMPEVCRALALQGAEILLLPAGVPKGPLWQTWRTLIFARAIENVCFTATCQNLFKEGDKGLTMICSPEGVLEEATEHGVFVADCDLERVRLLRTTADSWDFPGEKRCKPGIFDQWYRPELHGTALARLAARELEKRGGVT